MSGGAYWRWYIGKVDIERVLVSSGDMLQDRAERYRMLGWKLVSAQDALIEVFVLDDHTALVTECDTVAEARERFVSYIESAAGWFAQYKVPETKPDVEV